MKEHDGFILGLGMSAHFRFGEDPDSTRSIIRSIRFSETPFPPVFAAMQSFYIIKPLTSVTITNTEKYAIKEVAVSFFQTGFMDFPTASVTISELTGGESREVPLFAFFNQQVFTTEGITPLGGEIIVSYTSRGRAARQELHVTFDLHDKTAITWDDDRKAGAFITPADSALGNYSSFICQSFKNSKHIGICEPVRFAMKAFYALEEIGVFYQADPNHPFARVQGNRAIIDAVSLPRDTLKRLTGDCDDLTILFCTLLEHSVFFNPLNPRNPMLIFIFKRDTVQT